MRAMLKKKLVRTLKNKIVISSVEEEGGKAGLFRVFVMFCNIVMA